MLKTDPFIPVVIFQRRLIILIRNAFGTRPPPEAELFGSADTAIGG